MVKNFYLPDALRCPICGAALTHEGGSLYCGGERRHTYDIAKEGYVNLLPPGRAKNAKTGDSAEMIRAREVFLGGGGYDRYSREAMEFASGFMSFQQTPVGSSEPAGSRSCNGSNLKLNAAEDRPARLLAIDAGCGEGRHTVNMALTLAERLGVSVTAIGFDASKHGAAAAAKRYVKKGIDFSDFSLSGHTPKGGTLVGQTSASAKEVPKYACPGGPGIRAMFAAANIFAMPVADSSADIMTSLFAPLPDAEALRVLKPGGVLLICAAGEGHLYEMRQLLYREAIPSGGGAVVPEGFRTVGETTVEYTLELDSREEIMSLFTMTPFYHNAPMEGRERLERLNGLNVTVQVRCTVAKK